MKIIFTIITVLVGCIFATQGSINTQLTSYLKNPLLGALVNFSVGTITVIVLLFAFRVKLPDIALIKSIPLHLYIGGSLGVLFVMSIILFIPQIGVSTVLAASVIGQLIASVIIDNYGFFNIPIHPISTGRIAGIVLLIIGVILIQKY